VSSRGLQNRSNPSSRDRSTFSNVCSILLSRPMQLAFQPSLFDEAETGPTDLAGLRVRR